MKYTHTAETLQVLDDLQNRVQQLIEVNSLYSTGENITKVKHQNRAFESVLTLLKQVRETGHVYRGSSAVPDSIEPLVKTRWQGKQLRIDA